MTEDFVSAAELMAKSLGAPTHRFVTIPHPISSAGPERLASAAHDAAAACVQLLSTTTDPASAPKTRGSA
jgi:hypothetical protein